MKAKDLSSDIRRTNSAVAVAIVSESDFDIHLSPGTDEVNSDSLFEIGSVTKTITGTLLASMIVEGKVTLDTTLTEIIGSAAGLCGQLTLGQLATHSAGLPRDPPNLDRKTIGKYRDYKEPQLIGALAMEPAPIPGPHAYSNFGFMILGFALTKLSGVSYGSMLKTCVSVPLSIPFEVNAPHGRRLPAYAGNQPTSHRDNPIPGNGDVQASITAVAKWVAANLRPQDTPVPEALEMVHEKRMDTRIGGIGLAWHHYGDIIWHNGGTAGFHAFVGLHRAKHLGLAVLTNDGHAGDGVDRLAFRFFQGLDSDVTS